MTDYIEGRNGGKLKRGGSNKGSGRPRKIPELTVLINEVMGEETKGVTKMEEIVKEIMKKALKGDLRAAELLLKYSYGLPSVKIEHSTDGNATGGFFIALPSNQRDDK